VEPASWDVPPKLSNGMVRGPYVTCVCGLPHDEASSYLDKLA
jgi:hypothetical protein